MKKQSATILAISLLTISLLVMVSGCTNIPKTQEEIQEYCDSSEYSVKKEVGLSLAEIILGFFDFEVELNRGICENYYNCRDSVSTCDNQ